MEKRKLIPLSFMMLCSLCFSTACKTTETSTKNVLAVIGDKQITAENIYNLNLYNETTAEYIYGVLEEALIKSAVPATSSMRSRVETEVKKWKTTIKDNAKLNGTDYKEDLQAALEEQGVQSVEELIELQVYALQMEYAQKQFDEAKKADYHKAYIDSNYLYHVSDILLSTSGSSDSADLYGLTITSSEAESIYKAFTELVDGEKYYNIAEKYSGGDTAKNGGNLGVVSLNDTDITNELRYALIGYSSIIENKYNEFNLPTNGYSQNLINLYAAGMEAIPYSYIKGLNEVHSTSGTTETKNFETNTNFYYSGGNNYLSSTGRSYYRNIVFNVLLNTKTPRFITVSEEELKEGVNATKMEVRMPDETSQQYSTTKTEQYVLTNEYGNPYVVFKDSKGVHILSVQKTPFASDLYEYYSVDPSTEDSVISYSEFGKDAEERAAELEGWAENYITRNFGGNTGDSRLKSFEIFKYLLGLENNGGFKIVDEQVEAMINQYMNATIASAELQISTSYKENYDTYSNVIWFRNQEYIVQEIPLLSCLTKATDGNYGCTYKFGSGFLHHAPTSSNQPENEPESGGEE